MALFWAYTGLRVLVFLVLLGALWLVGVRGLIGVLVALVLGIPLSIYVLAAPRARLAAALQDHVDARNDHQASLRRRLNGEDDGDGGDGGDDDGEAGEAGALRERGFDPGALDGSHEAIDPGEGRSDTGR